MATQNTPLLAPPGSNNTATLNYSTMPTAPSGTRPSNPTSSSNATVPSTSSGNPSNPNKSGLRRRFGKLTSLSEWSFKSAAYDLENKGSVARDHLALERTYLAWIRTSLALASIGIAITQLFRLNTASMSTESQASSISSLSQLLEDAAFSQDPTWEAIRAVLSSQEDRLVELEATRNTRKYEKLAKPIGGTFIAVSLLFLALGTARFFKVQAALMQQPSQFPPTKRSVTTATFCVAAIAVAAFGSIVAVG